VNLEDGRQLYEVTFRPFIHRNGLIFHKPSNAVNTTFGRNDIPQAGTHSHGGGTADQNVKQADGNGFQKEGDQCHIHNHGISDDGGHDHGGENRPFSLGVWFIIRIE
jgi:hypothetical protein